MKRRTFVKQAGVATTASLFVPNILISKNTYMNETLGHGGFKYKIVTNWAQENIASLPVNDCHEMVQDSKKRLIFCTTEIKNNIVFLDKKGKFLQSWGHDFPGIHGLTLWNANGEEFLFITDTVKNEVYKTTLDGKVLLTLSYPSESGIYNDKEKVRFCPTETAIAPNGDIYVADGYGSSYILVYDSKGKFKNIFAGNAATDESKLVEAHGVCIDTRDKNNPVVLATSRKQNGFKRFSMDGKHLSSHNFKGSYLCRPVLRGENLYFPVIWSEHENGQEGSPAWQSKTGYFIVLDKNNKLISAPGVDAINYEGTMLKHMHQSDSVKGIFKHCHDVCIDDEESVYIPQWNSDKSLPLKLVRV